MAEEPAGNDDGDRHRQDADGKHPGLLSVHSRLRSGCPDSRNLGSELDLLQYAHKLRPILWPCKIALTHGVWTCFLQAMSKNGEMISSICVYCGSQPGRDASYREAARVLGASIAGHGLRLVYGGGTKGIMGAVASGVMSCGGKVTGIIPEFLMDKEATRHALGQLDELIVTPDMHLRKHTMFERSDAFVTLPGGIGTLEEIVEIMTWSQLGRHEKPMVFANINGFWDPMLKLIEHMAGCRLHPYG